MEQEKAEGFILERKGTIFGKKYQKYWYEIDKDKINKYINNQKTELTETIDLKKILSATSKIIDNKHSIVLTTMEGNNNILYFENENERDLWSTKIIDIVKSIEEKTMYEHTEIIQAIAVPCIITNDNFTIVALNNEAKKIFVYEKEELIGKNINIIFGDYSSKIYFDIFNTKLITEHIAKKIYVKTNKGNKLAVNLTISEYIIKKYLKRTYLHTFKLYDNLNDNINNEEEFVKMEHIKLNIFNKINDFTSELKKEIGSQYSNTNKIIQSYTQKIIILEDDNKNLIETIKVLKENIRQLTDKLNYCHKTSNNTPFINLLANDYFYESLLDYCIEIKNEENLLFWKDVTEIKKKYINNTSSDELLKEYNEIFKKYLDEDSTYLLNIPLKLIKRVRKKLDEDKHIYHVYDDVIHEIVELLYLNVYVRFINTPTGKKILELARDNSELKN